MLVSTTSVATGPAAGCCRATEASPASYAATSVPNATLSALLQSLGLLYIGGHPKQMPHLRAVAERLGADFLHHDGGIENHPHPLPGLISRADIVLFPADHVGHDAQMVESLYQQAANDVILYASPAPPHCLRSRSN